MNRHEHSDKLPDWLAGCRPPDCILCGAPSTQLSLYVPDPDSPIAPSAGTVRMIPYGLCDDCGQRRSRLLTAIECVIERIVLTLATAESTPTPPKEQNAGVSLN